MVEERDALRNEDKQRAREHSEPHEHRGPSLRCALKSD